MDQTPCPASLPFPSFAFPCLPLPASPALPCTAQYAQLPSYSFGSSSSYSVRSFTELAPALTGSRALKSLGSSMK